MNKQQLLLFYRFAGWTVKVQTASLPPPPPSVVSWLSIVIYICMQYRAMAVRAFHRSIRGSRQLIQCCSGSWRTRGHLSNGRSYRFMIVGATSSVTVR